MLNLQVNFSCAWLLLLIVPAVLLTLLPYFKLSKKFRKTRNRISSVVLHLTALVLCIFVLSGMTFDYEVHNSENELVLVVDASYSTAEEKQAKDDFVRSVIEMTNTDVYSLGIVTFGLKPVCAVPLTDDLRNAFNLYQNSLQPDVTATDISSALVFARDMLTHPESAKIVLLSDGVETDGKASSVVKSIVAEGTRIDSVLCGSLSGEDEVQALSVGLPDSNILRGEQFEITLSVASSRKGETPVTVTLFDNGEECQSVSASVREGVQDIAIPHSLEEEGLHALRFRVDADADAVSQNNELYSYMYLNLFDKVLIVESSEGISQEICALLEGYEVTTVRPDESSLPKTLDELCAFDEVILNNIANSDLPEGFDEILNRYVYEAGGGLFTVGGSEGIDLALRCMVDPGDEVIVPSNTFIATVLAISYAGSRHDDSHRRFGQYVFGYGRRHGSENRRRKKRGGQHGQRLHLFKRKRLLRGYDFERRLYRGRIAFAHDASGRNHRSHLRRGKGRRNAVYAGGQSCGHGFESLVHERQNRKNARRHDNRRRGGGL